jgi:hypothetical protein
MADDVTLPGTAEVIAADEVGSKKYQRIIVVHGTDGGAKTDTSSGDPFPVGGTAIDAINTSTASVAAAVKQTSDASSGTSKGVAIMGVRRDTLSASGVSVGDFTPVPINERDAQWVALDTALDASQDDVAIGARAGVGFSAYHSVSLAAKAQVKSGAATVGSYYAANKHATEWRYVRFYDALSASVTVGTTATAHVIALPPASAANMQVNWAFATGITVAAQSDQSDSGTTAAAANDVILDLGYI